MSTYAGWDEGSQGYKVSSRYVRNVLFETE